MKKIITLSITLVLLHSVFAQSGMLDSSFDKDGKVISNGYDGIAYASLLQPEGKILVGGSGGYYKNNKLLTGTLLARYNADGSPDVNFADSGKGIYILGDTAIYIPAIHAMTLQPDGKIVAVGDYAYQNGILGSISLMRFNADGSPDKNFGINGMTIIKVTNGPDQAKDVALLSDGRIIVAGMPKKDFYDYGDSFFACFTSDGKLDKNFGNVGIVIISGEDIPILINAIAITADDKIIAAGGGTNPSHALVRYNNDGTPDLSFGENGIATIFFDNNIARAEANDVNVDKDGSIITGGTAYYQSGKRAISVCKFMHDGKADKDFGQGGFNYSGLDKGDAYGNTIAVQQNGKIVIAGSYSLNDSGEFVVNRYTSAGLLDSSFGINGFQITSFFEEDVANSVNIQNDGKIVVVGSTQLANKSFVDIARYYGDESKKQILITKIKKWIQHHNGFTWDANSNVSDYVVQRSYDGIHFSSIARVNANNNSALTYEDPTPLSGINYYRLQTTGINGTVNYSNVLVVSANENTITISPNPAKNSLYIEGLSSNKNYSCGF